MKIINVNPGLLPIPPNGWGAIEKIIWDYHQQLIKIGIRSEIKYANEVQYDESCVIHVHVANLANHLHERNIPYIFSIHDHHAYLYGKDSSLFKENLKAIENSVFSLSPCKYLIPYFGSKKLRYFSHAVNTDVFKFNGRQRHKELKLLCVANNGYAYDQSIDRKGFKIAIQAAKNLALPITIAGPRNNENFFKTLDPELNNYPRLTKLYDLDEKWLIDLYNEHDAFLHFSELEAGHPNLTLLEAMACGLPIVGTFEEPVYDGMEVCTRNLDQAIKAISKVDVDYDTYRYAGLLTADRNSYHNRVYELANLYTEYREQIFGNQIIEHYRNSIILAKDTKELNNKIKIWFPTHPKVEILGSVNKKYKIKFIDNNTNRVVYESNIGNNMWSTASIKYFIQWKIEIYELDESGAEILINCHTLDLKNKSVKIVFDTNSLGDILAYIGAASKFKEIHECNLTCVVYDEHLFNLLKKNYTDIIFSKINDSNDNYYATYHIGYFDQGNWESGIQVNPKTTSLTLIAPHILGLPLIEYKPKINIVPLKHDKKYVCIGTQSTAQCKYWNNPNGWNDVVKYLNEKGYEVWCIDKHGSYGNGNNMNNIPVGVVDKTGALSLEERLSQIAGAEFFIGLGSGLSWLSWAAGQKVVLISGFSEEFAEFKTPYRVINKDVCHGCWNDIGCTFDKGNWNWCPRNKDFECTKQISSQLVINEIDKLIANADFPDFDWGTAAPDTVVLLKSEFFSGKKNVYERFFEVESGDIVLDLGAHIGAFGYSIKNKNPSRLIAVEPGKSRINTLKNNTKKLNTTILNVGISDFNGVVENGLFYEIQEDFHCITFEQLIKSCNIDKIDFMKTDCEGGEYHTFNSKYIDWIKINVRKIAGEWHICSPEDKKKFREFRDNILPQFKKYEVYSLDNVDIKWELFTDRFVDWYNQFYIYIDNR